MNKFSVDEVVEILAKTGSKEWNESLSKRLESLAAFLDQDEWTKGVSVYLKALQGNAVVKMLNEQIPIEGIHYLRGFVAALRLVTCLPQSIETQISQEQSKVHKGIPNGTAGY